jgi:hypothetical protein
MPRFVDLSQEIYQGRFVTQSTVSLCFYFGDASRIPAIVKK